MGDQGLAWLIFNVVFGSILFLPTLIALAFRRDKFLLVLLLNGAVLLTNTSGQMSWLYFAMIVALFWPVRASATRYGRTFLRPDKRKWSERQCPACAHWIARTAENCERCGHAVAPVDQSCPRCSNAMPPNATLCLSCGFDQKDRKSIAQDAIREMVR